MYPTTFYAHTKANLDKKNWQELREHLEGVASLTSEFVIEAWKSQGYAAGLWHDAGKYQLAFQHYIGVSPEASNETNSAIRSVPHSAAGAALAAERFGLRDARGIALALVIEAHHGSLKAQRSIEDVLEQRGKILLAHARQGGLPPTLEQAEVSDLPPSRVSGMAIRMLFSALVDADLLNTEAWGRGETRAVRGETVSVLADRLQAACRERSNNARPTALNAMRREVYESCVAQAAEPRGWFTLTVPTGGGKTLSGMAFALHHALKHGLRRVIVVAPYTSILEQTARAYRDVLGEDNVVEHHSNLDPAQDTDENRQAIENWDAPVIVTTSVQFFESLHAAHKADCRKLHRVARSVVLLDEVQTFPTGLLQPIHLALKLLVEQFGATVVHSTATQPLLAEKSALPMNVQVPLRPIVPEYARHFEVVRKRFTLQRVGDLKVPLSIEDVARHVREHPTVLSIVHNRREAQQLAELLGTDCLHLSASMCAEHRSSVLNDVQGRLKCGKPCRLVSTQLVEAGVDIDFPVVFRAMAGLETLAQAAGRCNREMNPGKAPGRFYVFRPPSRPPAGMLRLGMRISLDSYFETDRNPDLNDPDLFPAYARQVLKMQDTDSERVMEPESKLDFPTVAERFRMIDDAHVSLVAPYGGAMKNLARLRREGPTRKGFRRLQRFAVSIQPRELERLFGLHFLEPVFGGTDVSSHDARCKVLWTVREHMPQIYDARFGFGWQAGERFEPGQYIVGG